MSLQDTMTIPTPGSFGSLGSISGQTGGAYMPSSPPEMGGADSSAANYGNLLPLPTEPRPQ